MSSGETAIPDDFDAVDAYIAEQEDASGIAEVVAAHFVSSGETAIPWSKQTSECPLCGAIRGTTTGCPACEQEWQPVSSGETAIPDAQSLLGCAGPLPDVDVPEDAIRAAMEWDARDGCLLPDRHWFAGMLAAAMPALRRHIAAEDRPALDEALTLLADAIPDPDGAIHSTQWHQRMDALAARVVLGDDNA